MKKIIAIVTLSLVGFAGLAFAQDAAAAPVNGPAPMAGELLGALQDLSVAQIGALTVGDLAQVAARLSVASQRLAYVNRAAISSMIMPGAGQFMTGDTLGGVLFMTGNLALVAGTLAGVYFLLPADLQFTSLDYYTAPFSTIKATYESHSMQEYLPAAGVMAGGMLARALLAHVSARLATEEARENIAKGKVTFQPRMDFRNGGFMMGMRMRM
jgi:hypothetical protein